MTRRPEHDPLGAKPVLPPPTGAGAERARRVFEGYVKRLREGATLTELTEQGPAMDPGPPPLPAAPVAELVPPSAAAQGRHYGLALAKMGASHAASEDDVSQTAALGSTGADLSPEPALGPSASEPPLAEASESLPERPPPGAPTVRPTVRRKSDPETVPQELLEGTAESAMLVSGPDGDTSFDIAFNDDLFPNLACRITILDGKVVATFRVADPNLRRLLEAEAGRLRASLEDRGLKVAEVKVEIE